MFKYVKFTKVETVHTVLEFRGDSEDVNVNHFDVNVVSIESENEDAINVLIDSQSSEIGCIVIDQDEFKTIVGDSAQFLRIKKRVEDEYSKSVSPLIKLYPSEERETWSTQLEQARLFKNSGDELDAPFLKILADAEGDTVDNFADAVMAKALEYENFMAVALVEKRAFEKSLMKDIGL